MSSIDPEFLPIVFVILAIGLMLRPRRRAAPAEDRPAPWPILFLAFLLGRLWDR